jgi:hypothetical protein
MIELTPKERDLIKGLLMGMTMRGTIQDLPNAIQEVLTLIKKLDELNFEEVPARITRKEETESETAASI